VGIARADIPSGDVDAALRWAAICESSADAIMGGTLDGLITSWNAGAEQMYGYTAEEIVGHPVAQLVPPGLAGQLSSVLGRLGRGEVRPPYETKRLRKDGSIIEVSVTVSPILDASGTVIGASTVSRDLTERNRAEAARRALERQLQSAERLETLGRLAGGIAHDFNNLLAAILSYAGFVADETADRRRADTGRRAARGRADPPAAGLQPARDNPAGGAGPQRRHRRHQQPAVHQYRRACRPAGRPGDAAAGHHGRPRPDRADPAEPGHQRP